MRFAWVGFVLLWLSGCVTTCKTLRIEKQPLSGGRAKITWKCADKTVEATVDAVPPCLEACFTESK